MALQNAFIVMLIMQFTKRRFTGVLINLMSFVAIAIMNAMKMEYLSLLMLATIGLGIASKLPQIYSNFSAKSTGQLSLLTTFLQFGGTVARVLTTLQEVDDFGVLLSFIVAATLNGIVLAQIVVYQPKPVGTKSAAQKKKTK